ncbi:MAG TPA: PIG-L deacetylase family protein [Gaiellaceae bacterium]|nr:PIG-L deacetylase family protein [Gaiellaceae bacterium]
MVVAAHPDDEVLGCGGTIPQLVAAGRAVHVAILGEGVTSRYAEREGADVALLDDLRADSRRAGETMGAAEVHLFGLPDNRFDTVAALDVVKVVEGLIEELEPELVFTQHGGDLNVDHGVVFRAVLAATRPMAGHPVKRVYGYEVASSTEWAFGQFEPVFRPNTFVDVSQTLETKVAAMECYRSERRAFPHPRSPDALRAAARRWGTTVGLEAAEAFQLVRSIGL